MQAEYRLRPYTRADALQVVELVNADAAATIGARRAIVDDAGLDAPPAVPALPDGILMRAQHGAGFNSFAIITTAGVPGIFSLRGPATPRHAIVKPGIPAVAWRPEDASI